jgi:hypothetical protein
MDGLVISGMKITKMADTELKGQGSGVKTNGEWGMVERVKIGYNRKV